MTPEEWLASDDPAAMLNFLQAVKVPPDYRNHATPRKLRLFACAIWRQYHARWTGTSTPADYLAVLMEQIVWAEAWADGYWHAVVHDDARWPLLAAEAEFAATDSVNRFATATEARQVMASLLREIVGDPFRPMVTERAYLTDPLAHARVSAAANDAWEKAGRRGREGDEVYRRAVESMVLRQAWLTPTVLAIAGAAYDERERQCGHCRGDGTVVLMSRGTGTRCPKCRGTGRIDDGTLDPDRLAILADALEDAGCPENVEMEGPEILAGRECPYCANWPKDSPRGERGWVKCKRWKSEVSDDRYGRCDRCNRVWLPGFDTVAVVSRGPHPLLAHLRSPGPHVRGCHVVDLILGKS